MCVCAKTLGVVGSYQRGISGHKILPPYAPEYLYHADDIYILWRHR